MYNNKDWKLLNKYFTSDLISPSRQKQSTPADHSPGNLIKVPQWSLLQSEQSMESLYIFTLKYLIDYLREKWTLSEKKTI